MALLRPLMLVEGGLRERMQHLPVRIIHCIHLPIFSQSNDLETMGPSVTRGVKFPTHEDMFNPSCGINICGCKH